MNWRSSAAAAVVSIATAACHPGPPAHPGEVRLKPDATRRLATDIDAILARPALARGYWGVLVRSLKTGETLYAKNADKLMMPASNMKVVTLAAAAARLGWNFTYETTLYRSGTIENGVLDGDLVVVGSGDPSLVAADGTADGLFDEWARQLRAAGVRVVRGRLVGDDRAFPGNGLGFGWSWDDLPDDYAAGVGALQFNEDAARVTIAPGPAAGASAAVSIEPSSTGLTVDNDLKTGEPGSTPSIEARRLPGSSRLELRGSIPLGAPPAVRTVSVDNPTQYFVNALRTALIARGIDIRGPAVDIDDAPDVQRSAPGTQVAVHRSAPLSSIAVRLMKVSQNQYAETLLKTIGGPSSVQATLQPWGVADSALIQRDGSGLSRYDYVTPEAIVAILTHVARDENLRAPFEAALPIAGRDGTLGNRLKATAAEANARAKTGSMANVRALSGYETTADGEPLVFSVIANNFDAPAATIIEAIDAIVATLAQYRH